MGWFKSFTRAVTAVATGGISEAVRPIASSSPALATIINPASLISNDRQRESVIGGVERIATINPQSFTPANIIRGGTAGTLFVATAGLSTLNPQINGNILISSDTNRAGLFDSGYVGANSFGRVRAGNPNEPETFYNYLARLTGGTVSSIATGKVIASGLSTPANTLPSGVQGPTQPLGFLAKLGNLLGGATSTTATGYGTGQFAQGIIGIFGQKIGGTILSLLSGNFQQAFEILTTNPPSYPTNLYGPSGGGGGGGGFLPSQNTGQSTMNAVVIPLIGASLIGLLLWYFLRKKG